MVALERNRGIGDCLAGVVGWNTVLVLACVGSWRILGLFCFLWVVSC